MSNSELGERGGGGFFIMDFKENVDYVIIENVSLDYDFNESFYLKVLGGKEDYLGSIRIGLLRKFSEVEKKELIQEILNQYFPNMGRYTLHGRIKDETHGL